MSKSVGEADIVYLASFSCESKDCNLRLVRFMNPSFDETGKLLAGQLCLLEPGMAEIFVEQSRQHGPFSYVKVPCMNVVEKMWTTAREASIGIAEMFADRDFQVCIKEIMN